MKNKISVFLVATLFLLAGCAGTPQGSMPLAQDFYSNKGGTVGVYMNVVPKPDTVLFGASCLLCYATAAAANSSLTTQIKTLSTDELAALSGNVADLVKQKGLKVTTISTPIQLDKLKDFSSKEANFSKQDFRPLKEKLGVDKLIVINIYSVGAYRPYSAYVPTGAPTGYVSGVVYTVDLSTNKYDLYETLDFKINAQGDWDEPPKFPGVTNAYYQAIESCKAKVIALFK